MNNLNLETHRPVGYKLNYVDGGSIISHEIDDYFFDSIYFNSSKSMSLSGVALGLLLISVMHYEFNIIIFIILSIYSYS